MAGASEREKAGKSIYQRAAAPLDYGYKEMMQEVAKTTLGGSNFARQNAAELGGEAAKSTAASLQSRGVGGSVLQSAVDRARLGANKQASNTIQQLLLRKMMMNPQLMQIANQNKFSQLGAMTNASQLLSDDTWLDDMLGILNTAGNIAGSITGL